LCVQYKTLLLLYVKTHISLVVVVAPVYNILEIQVRVSTMVEENMDAEDTRGGSSEAAPEPQNDNAAINNDVKGEL